MGSGSYVTPSEEVRVKKTWEPMTLARVGHVGDVVKQGGGKLSPHTADPGEPRKPPGQA